MVKNVDVPEKDGWSWWVFDELQQLKEETDSWDFETIWEYTIMKDEKWKYIELEWKKYYENNRNWLWFSIISSETYTKELYIWNFKNWKYEWEGKYIKYYNYWGTYNQTNCKEEFEWNWKNWLKNWEWKETYKTWITYEWERVDDKVKEWKWTMTRPRNWERYVWDFLIDKKDWMLKPFYLVLKSKKKELEEAWEAEHLNKDMEWIRKIGSSYHKYKIINWVLHENATDFITMYGDNKPDEYRSKERWNIEYQVNYTSESHIEYRVTSWKERQVNRKFNWRLYEFMDDAWNTLQIPKSPAFWEKQALHAWNLINCIRYYNETKHYSWKYRFGKWNIYATAYETHGYARWWWISYSEYKTETNWTTLLKDVSKHFGWIEAWTLANWLNKAKRYSNSEEWSK